MQKNSTDKIIKFIGRQLKGCSYEGGPQKNRDDLLEGGPLAAQASPPLGECCRSPSASVGQQALLRGCVRPQ